ncbi:MAG TPA: nitrilase-related carbon-nitrogen hydrolase [Candidatus Acidoferrum sp.]|nr:nitrilase-related carbon-nitrogen hydrolase [Candidatus Acidoferrum sp.]
MAERPIVDSARLGDLRAPIRSAPGPHASTGLQIPVLAATATGLLYGLAAAQPLLYPCALLAPLPLLAVAPEIRTETAAKLAFLAYLIGNLVAWGGESFAVPLMTMFAAHLAGAIVFATFVACAVEATRRWSGWLAALVFPTFETAFYFTLAGESPHGTWGAPAYAMVDFVPLLQSASWLGMCGVMFIMTLLPAGLAVAWYRRRWNMDWAAPAIMALGAFAIAVLLGWIRILRTPTTPSVRVAMIASQGHIPESESTNVIDAADIVAEYAKIVRQVAGKGVQVVVLPEKIIGVAPSYEWDVVQGFQRIASMSHVWLVVGLNQIGRTPKRNIAVVFGPDGKIAATYAKHHLVPSLESDYKPGSKPAIFDPPWGRTAVLISQDLDFPDTARELAAHDVRIVMAPASDWTGSELIHQRMAVVRGVEFGFSLARSARAGVVSANDPRGREIVARAPVHGEASIATASLALGAGRTIYFRTGDWFGRLCQIFTILLMLRLGVTLLAAAQTRRRGAAKRVRPEGVVSVDVVKPEQQVEQESDEDRIYRPPVRPRE